MEGETDPGATSGGSERAIDRRTCLTATAALLAAIVSGGADIGRTTGYGAGGYGNERYGT